MSSTKQAMVRPWHKFEDPQSDIMQERMKKRVYSKFAQNWLFAYFEVVSKPSYTEMLQAVLNTNHNLHSLNPWRKFESIWLSDLEFSQSLTLCFD